MKTLISLLLIALCSFPVTVQAGGSAVPPRNQKVSFITADGIQIVGVYRAPAKGKRTVILLHGLGSTKEEWEPFEKLLAENGYGYLAFDARGHGESVKDTAGRTVTYNEFGRPGPGSSWNRMPDDLLQAADYLIGNRKLQEKSIGVAGASLGANVAMVYAARNRQVPFAVLLSPGLNYAGIETAEPLRGYGQRPVLIAASASDQYSYRSCAILRRIDQNAVFLEGPGGHGVQMFNGAFEKQIIRWMDQL